MKFVFDVGVSKLVETWLTEMGHDVKAIRDIDPKMEDKEIIRIAIREKRILVTMDKDFGELVHKAGMNHHGVLLLRLESATSSEKITVIQSILEHYGNAIEKNFCVYQNNRLRIRTKKSHSL